MIKARRVSGSGLRKIERRVLAMAKLPRKARPWRAL